MCQYCEYVFSVGKECRVKRATGQMVGNATAALALDEPYILRASYATCRSWDEVQQKWRDNNCEVRTVRVRVTQHSLTWACETTIMVP